MQLTKDQEISFNKIYLRILMQITIEVMDELKGTDAYNGKMRVKANDFYQTLDKDVKKYDELYQATEAGTAGFYTVVKSMTDRIIKTSLPDQAILFNMLEAFEKDEKSVMGIVRKILKNAK